MIAEGMIGGKVVARVVKKYPERTTAVNVTVDDAGVGSDGGRFGFVPVRATIVDNKGVPKVLASEYVYFEVEGPGEIIAGPGSHANPVRTEFGTATALLRATTKPGLINVKGLNVKGHASGEAYVVSTTPSLSLAYDSLMPPLQNPRPGQVPVVHRSARQSGCAEAERRSAPSPTPIHQQGAGSHGTAEAKIKKE